VRYLLLIPVIAIFLSNVPLKMEMNMPAQEVKEECCSGEAQEEMSCHPEPEATEAEDDGCCSKKETTCVCFCCFQLAAPLHAISKYRFANNDNSQVYGLYQHPSWKNPWLDGPLQPPDTV
jgi:hypothetical protein